MICTFYGTPADFRAADQTFEDSSEGSICGVQQDSLSCSEQCYPFSTNENSDGFERRYDDGENLLHREVGDDILNVPLSG